MFTKQSAADDLVSYAGLLILQTLSILCPQTVISLEKLIKLLLIMMWLLM